MRVACRSARRKGLDIGEDGHRGIDDRREGGRALHMALVRLRSCRRQDVCCRTGAFEVIDGVGAPFGGTWVVAATPLMKLRGLSGRPPDDTVMVFPRCKDVHTLTMAYPIDIAFAGRDGVVQKVHRSVRPGARLRRRDASFVLERFAREGPWFERGDCVLISNDRLGGRCSGARKRSMRWI